MSYKARLGSLIHAWQRQMCYTFLEIYLWCDTCQPLGNQRGSWKLQFSQENIAEKKSLLSGILSSHASSLWRERSLGREISHRHGGEEHAILTDTKIVL